MIRLLEFAREDASSDIDLHNMAAATNVATHGGQGYSALLEARDNFKTIVSNIASHYSVCVEEDMEDEVII